MRGWVKITPLENAKRILFPWKLSEIFHHHTFRDAFIKPVSEIRHSLGQLNLTWVPFSSMVRRQSLQISGQPARMWDEIFFSGQTALIGQK